MTNSRSLRAVNFEQVNVGDFILHLDEYKFYAHDYRELIVRGKNEEKQTIITNMNGGYELKPNIDGHFFIVSHD